MSSAAVRRNTTMYCSSYSSCSTLGDFGVSVNHSVCPRIHEHQNFSQSASSSSRCRVKAPFHDDARLRILKVGSRRRAVKTQEPQLEHRTLIPIRFSVTPNVICISQTSSLQFHSPNRAIYLPLSSSGLASERSRGENTCCRSEGMVIGQCANNTTQQVNVIRCKSRISAWKVSRKTHLPKASFAHHAVNTCRPMVSSIARIADVTVSRTPDRVV
jgi:hypothetical protein